MPKKKFPIVKSNQNEMEPQEKGEQNASDLLIQIAKGMEKINERLDALEGKGDEPPNLNQVKHSSTTGEGRDIIEVVSKILGGGDAEKCEFDIKIQPKIMGLNFELVITPPEHLKEKSDDIRVKVIPYTEAISGAEVYAQKVFQYCNTWCTRNGRTFFSKK